MKQQVAAGILAASMIGGIGTGVVAHQLRSDDPKEKAAATPSTTATIPAPDKTTPAPADKTDKPPAAPSLQPVGSLKIYAGMVGPVKVGMTKSQAFATGYLDKDVTREACGTVDQLAWKAAYKGSLDIFTLDDGEVSSIGVSKPGPSTRSGLQVGSTYKAVKGVLGEESQPMEAGYSQTGLFVNEGSSWIGFLFDGQPDTISDSEPVRFIEVTRGRLPDLMRDGC